MNALELARPEIRAMQAYSSARMEARGGTVMLNANESPWPPFAGDRAWNRYPDSQPAALVARLAELYGAGVDELLVGRGSDEGIDLLVRAFCRAGQDAVLISPPTFGMYAVSARVQGATVVEAPLRADFSLDVNTLLAKLTPAVKLVFVCAPNNPAGAGVPRAAILHLAEALADRAVLVVDEAYIEFVEPDGFGGSVAASIRDFENLVVLRTLSKAWALAGVRIGALIANADVAAMLRKIMPPYPLPVPCVDAAMQALSRRGELAMRGRVASILNERTRMQLALAELPGVRAVLPSQANFLTVRFHDAEVAFEALSDAGVVVRDVRRYPGLGDALRITIGSPEEDECVLEALRMGANNRAGSCGLQRAEQPA